MEFFTEATFSGLMKKVAKSDYTLIDSHTHAYEYTPNDLMEIYERNIGLVSVAEDLDSSIRNLKLSEESDWIKPCVGIHPWRVSKSSTSDLKAVERAASSNDIVCIGEIGLDTKFTPETIDRQREFFLAQLKLGKEYDLPLNLHTAGTWREVYELLIKHDVPSALFHWYTGPLDLLGEIAEKGYLISINPSVTFQAKHRRVAEEVDVKLMLLESDGPYEYRGVRLWSPMILETARFISELKGVPEHYIYEVTYLNTVRLFNLR